MAKELTKMSEREIFDRMNALAYKYDPFIQYIDDYKQFKTAEIKNKEASEEWDAICTYIGVENASIRTYAEDIDCIKENLGYLFAESKMFSKNKEEETMEKNTIIIAMNKEEVEMKTKDQIRVALEAVGVEMSNTQFKKTKKAELVAMLEKYLDPSKKVEIVEVNGSVEEANEKKEASDIEQKYMDAKWDRLVKAVAAEYVKQSLGVKWALFYKNTKSTTTKAEYMVKTKKLWGATSKVIKNLYGEEYCNEENIKQTLNAMVVRGYLNFQKIKGVNGNNVIFNATADQMNTMWKLSK